jgi:hypothetical protein
MPKNVEWRQLCAIATEQIRRDPTIDDSEWAERIKRRLVALHLAYPLPHEITAAMRASERALSKVWGRRPTAVRGSDGVPRNDAPAPLSHAEAVAALRQIAGATSPIKTLPRVRVRSARAVDVAHARRIYAQALVEQIERCEAAERALEDATRTASTTEPGE